MVVKKGQLPSDDLKQKAFPQLPYIAAIITDQREDVSTNSLNVHKLATVIYIHICVCAVHRGIQRYCI